MDKMDNIMDIRQKRMTLFLLGCIPVRMLFVYLSYRYPSLLPYMATIALMISIGFLSIFFFHLRPTGPETFGQPIWWNQLRPVHSLLYLLFAYFAFSSEESKRNQAWIFLLLDVLLGLSAFSYHYSHS
jgi:hypothetical protein